MRVIITGASRGIGKAFALKFAQAGAHVALLARSETAPSHQALKGTLQDVKKEVEAAGGRAEAARRAEAQVRSDEGGLVG